MFGHTRRSCRVLARASGFLGAGVAALLLATGTVRAQDSFGFPSCLASLTTGPASEFGRLVPAGASPPVARQLRGVVARAATWKPGQALKICFRAGTAAGHRRVIRVAREWQEYANVVFDFEENGSPRRCSGDGHEDIKIDFIDNQGWWSAYGRLSRQRDPSMNLQFFGVDTPRYANGQPAPEAELRRIILHEFGHALGMMHEHQSPAADCDNEIDWEAAYKMGAKLGWDRNMVHAQLRQLANSEEFNFTTIDRKSIMHYSLSADLFKLGRRSKCWVPDNNDLSEQDRRFMASMYPRTGGPVAASGRQTVTRGVRPLPAAASNDPAGLAREYEDLLNQAGVPVDQVGQLTGQFRKNFQE
jgi:Astacin (Peptidase family M12A)